MSGTKKNEGTLPCTSDSEISKYKKSGIHGIVGELYQAKLLMLFLYRAVQNRYDFLLATEMVDAEKFDDIVFQYSNNGKTVYRFVQAKHVADESKPIKMAEMENEGDKNFGLLKYFNSFRKIKVNPIFKDKILKEFTVCTNIDFDDECLSSFQPVHDVDDILDVSNCRGSRYQFMENFPEKNKVYNLLRIAAPMNRLAHKLARCVLYGEIIEEEKVKYSDFKNYYKLLARKVVDIKNHTFYESFLAPSDAEPDDVKIFRDIFVEEVSRLSNESLALSRKVKSQREFNTDENILIQIKEANIKLKISKSFEKIFCQISVDLSSHSELRLAKLDMTNDQEIKEFLEKLVFAVNQPNEKELGEIIEREIGKEFTLFDTAEVVYNKLFVKMLNWMKSNDGRFFSYKDGSYFFKEAKKGVSVWFDVLQPSEYFTGRGNQLDNLHSLLQKNPSKIACVVGLGGIGKSEMVRKYINLHSEDYGHNIVWIHAENRVETEESFVRLAKDYLNIATEDNNKSLKDIKSIVSNVYSWFSNKSSLFIFDNAVKFKTTLGEGIDVFLPNVPKTAMSPHIIVTSRNREWDDSKFHKIEMDIFTKDDAREFIIKALNIEASEEDVVKLAEQMQNFPLALNQSVAYIKEVNKQIACVDPSATFTIADYLTEFKEKTKELLNFQFPDDYCNACTKTTFTTWNITMDRIKTLEIQGQTAIEVLDVLSYLSPENIPSSLFMEIMEGNLRKLGSVLNILKKYCMIDLQRGLITVHRLVQLVNRSVLDENGEERGVLIKCIEILGCNYPADDLLEDCAEMRKLIPHLESVLTKVDELNLNGKPPVEERHYEKLLKYLSHAYGNLGFIVKEKDLCERLLNFVQDRHGDTDPRTAEALVRLATALGDLGDHKKQEELTKKAMDIFNSIDFTGSVELAAYYCRKHSDALEKLGSSYRHLGRLREAKECFEEALLIQEKIHGCESHQYANVLQKLALVYGCKGDHKTELEMLEKSLPLLKAHYGEDHFYIGTLYGMLGAALSDSNKQTEALDYLYASPKILERHYGSDHYQVGQTLGDIGISYMALGDYSAAKESMEKYLEIFESHFGPENIELEAPLSNLAYVLGCLGVKNRQIYLLERLLKIQKEYYGHEHYKISSTENMILTAHLGMQWFATLSGGLTVYNPPH